MKVIGITGSIATGKSTVTKYLQSKGYLVLDADKIVHKLFLKGEKGYELLVENFGLEIINANNNAIDRTKLSKIVFSNKLDLNKINQLIHPLVYEYIETALKNIKDEKVVFLDVPLLFESKINQLCDLVVCVYASFETQVERLIEFRGFERQDAMNRIKALLPIDEICSMSDIILKNEKGLEELHLQIDELLSRLEVKDEITSN